MVRQAGEAAHRTRFGSNYCGLPGRGTGLGSARGELDAGLKDADLAARVTWRDGVPARDAYWETQDAPASPFSL